MARSGVKQRHKENTRLLNLFWKIVGSVNAVSVIFAWFRWSNLGHPYLWMFCFLSCVSGEMGAMWFLSKVAHAVYDVNGKLSDCGDVSSKEGLTDVAKDVLFVCLGSESLSAVISPYFWFVLLIIPVFGAIKSYSYIILPFWQMFRSGSDENTDSAVDEKRELKRKRKEARRAKMMTYQH